MKKSGISIILVILIIGALLVVGVIISDIIFSQAKITKGHQETEIVYFSAESAQEKAAYDIFKNYSDITTYSLSGTLTNGASYQLETITLDTKEPGTSNDISSTNPWDISLGANQSLIYNLDINGATYPATLTIDQDTNKSVNLIIYQESKTGGTSSQTFISTLPYNLSIDSTNYYYIIRLENINSSTLTYTLTPSSDALLPIGIYLKTSGTYSGYKRIIEGNFRKWQIID